MARKQNTYPTCTTNGITPELLIANRYGVPLSSEAVDLLATLGHPGLEAKVWREVSVS
jgi:hypothetical protein